jgi:multidrug transporter EmrE-like cation transporter
MTSSRSNPLAAADSANFRYPESLPASAIPPPLNKQSVLLVFCCTLLGAAAQILIKTGANKLAHPTLLQMAMNLPLVAGYGLYGISTVLLILALRNAQLSVLYPIISLTYVWVTILSVIIFDESMNIYKVTGLAIVVCGVAVLGTGGRKT